MDIDAHRRRRLQDLVEKETQGNVAEFARRHNQDAARLRQVLNPNYRGGKGFKEGVARRLEADLKLSPLYFDLGLGLEVDPQHTSSPDDSPSTGQNADVIKRLLPDEKGNVVAWENESDLPHDPERVWIDRYDYHFSAGSGVIQWEVREKKALPFDAGFFKSLGSKPKDCKLVVVRGDSMEPFLFNRDMMMIDSSRVAIKEGHIYAIHFEDEALVKLIFKQAGGGLLLRSYNSTKYPDKIIGPDQSEFVTIAGELIYRSGSGPAGGN